MGEENMFGGYTASFKNGSTYSFLEFEKIWNSIITNKDLSIDINDILTEIEDDEVKAIEESNPCKDIIKKKYVPKKISAKR